MSGVERRLIPLPPSAPRLRGRLLRGLGRGVLWLGGWRMEGEFPDLPKVLLIVAPHSSGWDAVWALAVRAAIGLDVRFMGKAELFRGPLGWLLRSLGGLPVNRSARLGVVEQMAARFERQPAFWLALAPEGTRGEVVNWRTGFWHIARAADVPVLCVYFHYPERVFGIGPAMTMSGDLATDMAAVRDFYRPWIGKRRGTV